MTAEWWRLTDDASQDNVFNNHPTIFQNISYYFRPPSKIIKPASRNQSPRNKSRRRMTTQFPVRTRSVADPQRNGTHAASQQRNFDITSPTRPVSWHPTFTNDFSQHQDPVQQCGHAAFQPSPCTIFAHGLVTPTTYPAEVEPYIDCAAIPLDQLTEQDYQYLQEDTPVTQNYCENFSQDLANYAPLTAPPMNMMDYGNLPWPSVPFVSTYNITTAPASPNYLPIPDTGHSFDFPQMVNDDDGKEELVGMGLYDSPGQVQSSGLLFSGSLPVRRKNLKLEESFELPAEDCDAADVEADAEADADPEAVPIEGDDDFRLQEESDRFNMIRMSEQLQPSLESFNSASLHHNGEPYFVQDFESVNYHRNTGESYVSTYGWF